jgi:hypothetical protein
MNIKKWFKGTLTLLAVGGLLAAVKPKAMQKAQRKTMADCSNNYCSKLKHTKRSLNI